MTTGGRKLIIFCLLLLSFSKMGWGQLHITTKHNAEELLQMLLGTGVEVSNVSGTGILASNGVWQAGKFYNGANMQLGIDSGVLLTTGSALLATGPNSMTGVSSGNSGPGDDDLNALLGTTNNKDACVLEFDFVPFYDTLRFRYVLGSDEYNEFLGYSDVFAFFVSGPNPAGGLYNKENIALLPTTTTGSSVVQIGNLNNGAGCPPGGPCKNCEYFVNNCTVPGLSTSIEYDGYSVVLTAVLIVVPCQKYHIKLAIQDKGDDSVDSGVFLEAGSFSSPGVALEPNYTTPGGDPYAVEGCTQANLEITLPFALPDTSWVVFDSITGSATNGVDYNMINDSVMFLPNQLIVTIPIIPVYDALTEGDENIFLYLSNQVGCAGVNVQRTEIMLHDFIPVNIGSDTSFCEGSSITLDAGGEYKTYNWHDGSTGQTWTSPTTSGNFHVTLTVIDSWGCPSSDEIQLNIFPRPSGIPIRHN